MAHKIGQTLFLDSTVSAVSFSSVGSKKEGEGPLGKDFDLIYDDPYFGEDSFEKAECKMQSMAKEKALEKAGLAFSDIDFSFGGDLLNQCIASGYSARGSGVPMVGLYGACSTYAEAIALAAFFSDSCNLCCLASASSHFCSAERQYRFPLEYGGQRPPSAQWTATASGAVVVKTGGGAPFIKAVTFGTVEDLGINDANNMGAAMAPAAAKTLCAFFKDSKTKPDDYDLILTGDLGFVGAEMLKKLMEKSEYPLGGNYGDCGLMLYDREAQQVEAGASGCGCSAAVGGSFLLPRLKSGELKNALLLSTGALMSPLSVQQGETIPGIAHLICFSGGAEEKPSH